MKFHHLTLPLLLLIAGCAAQTTIAEPAQTLTEARAGFKTNITTASDDGNSLDIAPPKIFRTLAYPAHNGRMAAYLTPNPGDGKKHPAIIWITGGDCNSIGDVWSPASPNNDQTAAAYRQAGIIMMFPSLRGGNRNPGIKEGFLGEVDDVLSAAKFLEKQPYIDPNRIYLGGHSTGGTLAMLVAEYSPRFRGVFAFGPVADVSGYGAASGFLPFEIGNEKEVKLRSPGYWLSSIQTPTWVLEGTRGNVDSLHAMAKASTNPKAHFIEIQGVNHFATLAPTNALIAKKILADTGETSSLDLTSEEVNANFAR